MFKTIQRPAVALMAERIQERLEILERKQKLSKAFKNHNFIQILKELLKSTK